MRLVQRHGRIDRIGSPHDDVYIGCAFPDQQLERLLTIELRVRRKLSQAAATIGVESEVVPEGAVQDVTFTDNTKEIEAIRRGETNLFENAGEDPYAHSGEEYRQILRKGLETRRSLISDLPWAAGSGFINGMQDGHFFCCRIGDRTYLRFVPSDGSDIVTDTLQCLQRIYSTEDTPREITDDLRTGAYNAWERARDSVFDTWQVLTDPANLQPRIRPLFHQLANHLGQYPPSNVSQSDIDRTIDALQAPWSMRIENTLRSTFKTPDVRPHELSNLIYERVIELGLEPFIPPDPVPPIEKEEISLVCWLAVSAERA